MKPLTSQELVQLVYQLPGHPERRDAVIEEIRKRGIDFELTSGLRGVVATKSGSDVLLRRTLEEAARRRADPAGTPPLPAETETQKLLEQARAVTLAVKNGMPDFVVKQLVTRAYALGTTQNWRPSDRLTVAVSYRDKEGEQYKLLTVNGLPPADDGTTTTAARNSYEQAGGTSSTGEFVSTLVQLFEPETQAVFQASGTDTLRARHAIIYDYAVKKQNSKQTIGVTDRVTGKQNTIVGYRGRVWIDRETFRVLRLEDISTEIDPAFPITAATNTIDYDWVDISGKKYLLPIRSEVELTSRQDRQVYQSRNEIRFRNYQRYGTEVKIIDDDDEIIDEPAKKP